MTLEPRTVVLVVDDDADTRRAVRETLREYGYSVAEAVNGKEALEFLVGNQRAEPSLILLDVEMPIMTGWEFLELVKNYPRLARIPVLVATGEAPGPDASTHAAIVGSLRKPFDRDQLLAKVQALTHKSIRPPT